MRLRLQPDLHQALALADACAQARFVWNLGLEQRNMYRPAFGPTPGFVRQTAQLTEARAAHRWLAAGSQTVQQQALKDLDQAFSNWWKRPDRFGRPTWRIAGVHEGFRQVAVKPHHVRRVSHRWGTVHVPKIGPVKFRMSRDVPDVKSYRITQDRAGRWWVAFAHIPPQIDGPGDGTIVGIDRGVAVSFQTSDDRQWQTPECTTGERQHLLRLQRKLARQRKGWNRRDRTKRCIARLKAREADRRKDLIEQATTELARTCDVVRIEDLKVANMVKSASGTIEEPGTNVAQKRGLNRSISKQGWTIFADRLDDKIGARCQRVPAADTSRRCSRCGHTALENRESQAVFRCRVCDHTDNADVNAAINIAAGHAVTGRGDLGNSRSTKRQPQLVLLSG